jgi:c-di-GMP-binding flagellar brake protein YcgR
MPFLDTQPAPLDPGSFDDPYAQFRCEHPREVLGLLRNLRDATTPVALSSPGGGNLNATLWSIDADHQRVAFDVESSDPHLSGLVEADEATAVAYLDAVKLQFDLQDMVLVRSAQATALQCRLPRMVYRFQRRGSYRVRPPERNAPHAVFRHPGLPDMQLSLRMLDVSIGGCALLLPPGVPTLPLGVVIHSVLIELDLATHLRLSLRLQHASSIMTSSSGMRLGCEFLTLDAGTERTLQRYIDQTQKRRRLLSID